MKETKCLIGSAIGGICSLITSVFALRFIITMQAGATVSRSMQMASTFFWMVKVNIALFIVLSILWIAHIVVYRPKKVLVWLNIVLAWNALLEALIPWRMMNQIHTTLMNPTMLNILSVTDTSQSQLNRLSVCLSVSLLSGLLAGALSLFIIIRKRQRDLG